jgi:hypothetical protein
MASRVLALVEHPASEAKPARSSPEDGPRPTPGIKPEL